MQSDTDSGPVVDLLDQRGRLRRFVLAVMLGTVGALGAGTVAYWLSTPDQLSPVGGQMTRAWRFVFYLGGLGGALTFAVTQALLSRRARRRWDAARVPAARISRRKS